MAETENDRLRAALVDALGSQYEVLRMVGRGGMGAVYLARDRMIQREVAIKVLPLESAGAEDARERFLREARIAAGLTHPNIVPLYFFGEAGSTFYYVMRFVHGESLEQRLRRVGKPSPDETRRILGEIAAALEYAHGLGIVHRDLKPDNVLLETSTGRAVLTDFGIARMTTGSGATLTHTGSVVGTPHYMSPEQAAGDRDIDGRSDLYALGVIGYRMLAGRLPFEGVSVQEVMASHITRDPTPLRVVAPDTPGDLESAVARCLAKNPADRWRDAALLKEVLTSADAALDLPDDSERLPSAGSKYVLWAYVSSVVFVTIAAATGDTTWLRIIGFIWVGLLPALAVLAGPAAKAGISWKRLMTMAFWQPPGWGHWWPRALRRPGDVFDRLPAPVRRFRKIAAVLGGFMSFVSIPAFVIAGAWAGFSRSTNAPSSGDLFPIIMGSLLGQLAALVTLGVSYQLTYRWLKRLGLGTHDSRKMMLEPTHGSRFWTRPDIARFLSTHDTSRSIGIPETPAKIVAELVAATSKVSGPLLELVRDAAAAARDVVRALESVDAELQELARHGGGDELRRVEEKLASLGRTRAGESEAARDMRSLFEGQRDLLRNLAERAVSLEERRARYGELLRTLWLQVSVLRTQHAADAMSVAAAADVTGRIRQLCRDAGELTIATESPTG